MRKTTSVLIVALNAALNSMSAQPSQTLSSRSMVIYDRGMSFVTELRKIDVPTAAGTLLYDRLPPGIPESSFFVTAPFVIQRIESIPPKENWLQTLQGKEIALSGISGSVVGILKSIHGTSVYLENDKGTIFIPDVMQYRLQYTGKIPEMEKDQSLAVTYSGAKNGTIQIAAAYQVPGLQWNVWYEAALDEKNGAIRLSTWAEIENNTGYSFGPVSVRLLAGDVSRVSRQRMNREPLRMEMSRAKAMTADSPEIEENSVSEYYSFDIKDPVDLSASRTRKVLLFEHENVKVTKTYVFDGYPEINELKPVPFVLTLQNDQASGLGRMLPAGTVRFYSADARFTSLIGEQRINQLPENEKVELSLGSSREVLASHWLQESKQITQRVREEVLNYRLANRKKEAVVLILRKNAGVQAKVTASDVTWITPKADLLEARISLKPGEEKSISVTIRYTYE
jgi:hypothetical protein